MIVGEGNLSPRQGKGPVGHVVAEFSTSDGEHKAVFFPYSGDVGMTSELSHFVGHVEEVVATGYHLPAMDGYPLALVFSHQPVSHLPVISFVLEKVLVQMLLVGRR